MKNKRIVATTLAAFCISSGLLANDNTPSEGSKVNILWIRHGFSCANLIKSIASDKTNYFRSTYAPDSRVTNIGLEYAKAGGDLVKEKTASAELQVNPDHVYTSTLLRTTETASAFIKGWGDGLQGAKINIIPHMSEKRLFIGSDKDNHPRNFSILAKDLSEIEGAIDGLQIPTISPYRYGAYQLTNKSGFMGYNSSRFNDPATTKPNKDKLLSETLPQIAMQDESFRDPAQMTVFVSHGHFINSITGIKPENVGAILQTLVYKNGKYVPISSQKYFHGFSKIKAENLLNGHFDRCKFTANPKVAEIMDQSDDSILNLKGFFSFKGR